MPFTGRAILSVSYLSPLRPSGSFWLPVAVLVGLGGGIFGNTEGVSDNQSGSEVKNEQEGRV